MMPWDGFADMKSEQEEAKRVMQGEKPKFKVANVMSTKGTHMEISRVFQVASEAELKNFTGRGRLRKSDVDAVPVLTIPNEKGTGEDEKVFVFSHPEKSLRELRVTSTVGTLIEEMHLASQENRWAQQNQEVHTHALTEQVPGERRE